MRLKRYRLLKLDTGRKFTVSVFNIKYITKGNFSVTAQNGISHLTGFSTILYAYTGGGKHENI